MRRLCSSYKLIPTWKMAATTEGKIEEAVFSSGPKLVPITLTYVQYEQGDVLGLLLAWFSLLPIFILVGFVALILVRRDLHTMFFCLGIVINEGLNLLLKHVIKEPRPENDVYPHTLFVEYGMPSSHVQFMACFTTYFCFFMWIRVHLSVGSRDCAWKVLLCAGAVLATFGVCISRWYLGYHSSPQVLFGLAAGCLIGLLWFCVVHVLLQPLFPDICSWSISEFFLVKDLSSIPNYLWFEYTSVRQETRKRMRTKSQ